jgi:hypothetical protein
MFRVWLRTDDYGTHPLIEREGAALKRDDDSAVWQLVAQTDDHGEAVGVVRLMQLARAADLMQRCYGV